jgi:hypothetical protein
MAPTKALVARDGASKSVRRRDATSSRSGVSIDAPATGVTDAGKKSAPLWEVLLALTGTISVTIIMLYGIPEFFIRWRQKKADDEYADKLLEDKEKLERKQKGEVKLAKKYPVLFVEKVILRKNPGSAERRAAMSVLFVNNPEWVEEHKMLLSGLEFRNGTTLQALSDRPRNGTAYKRFV